MSGANASVALPTAVDRLVGRLYRVFRAQSVVLFGSYARGEQTLRSDIDLLAVLPDDQLEEAERRRGQLVSGLFPNVDLVFTTPRELADARGERSAFLRSVIEHGTEQRPESCFPVACSPLLDRPAGLHPDSGKGGSQCR